jgi:hypothetical protein
MKGIAIAVLFVYVVGYAAFKERHSEIWAKDCKHYVIFPDTTAGKFAYYVWRPLTYIDASLFQTGIHIGPHQETST